MKTINVNNQLSEKLATLTESELWQISRYMADYAKHEIDCGKKVDKHTFFWAFDAILVGALDD
jgi:hypothetical protein